MTCSEIGVLRSIAGTSEDTASLSGCLLSSLLLLLLLQLSLNILRQIFREKLVVRAAYPNPLWKQHRFEVYDLFLPLTGEDKWKNTKRRFILNHFLNGNLTDPDVIEHFCPFGHCLNEEEVRSCFARLVANALIPSKPPKYARGRWTNYDLAVSWCGLLEAHHSLLKQVIVQYTAPRQKIPQLPKRIADLPPGEDSDGSDKWDDVLKGFLEDQPLPIHDTRDDKSEGSQGEKEADPKVGGFHWIEFNKRQKAQAGKFVSSDPYASIAIMQQVCRHMLAVMHYFLLVSGDAWERRQEHNSSQGEMRKYKVLECANGEALKRAFDSLVTSLNSPPIALPDICHTRHHRNKFFAMISKGLCAMHQVVRMEHRGFPFRLFQLLEKGMPSLQESPCCLHDELTSSFREHFFGNAGRFVDAPVALEALAICTSVDVAKIECRHASNRDLTMLRGSGWTPSLSVISAKFSCGTFKPSEKHNRRKVKKHLQKQTKTRRPGGAWRAFLSQRLQAQRWNEDPSFGGKQLTMHDLSIEYHQLSDAEKTYFAEVGRLATIAGRHGYTPFGKRVRKSNKFLVLPQSNLEPSLQVGPLP